MFNLKILLAYDGRAFYGWQKTDAGPSIEAELQGVLEQILQHPVKLQAASRTDRGVHAEGQVVNFFTEQEWDLDYLRCSCNRLLPKSIRVLSMEVAEEDFHPSCSSIGKRYRYEVMHGTLSPLLRHRVWNYPYPLDLDLMQQAANGYVGKRDFADFESVSAKMASDTVCHLHAFDVERTGDHFVFELVGDRFLYKMVRNLVGAACAAGSQHKRVCAPAHGLILSEVIFADAALANRIDL